MVSCRQRPKDKGTFYALHAPEMECISKGKARQPCEFGVKVSLAITETQGLIVGPGAFPGDPYNGHTLAEQTNILLQDVPQERKTALVDRRFRGVDAEVSSVHLIHRGNQFPDSLLLWRYPLLKSRASRNVNPDANTRNALTRL
jgi:IS5 family transposase